MKYILLAFTLLLTSIQAIATEYSYQSKITMVQSYPEYGEGDVIFKINNPATICKGYWLSPSTPGFNANLSLVLSAYHSTADVRIWGHEEASNKWPGSTTHLCKLYSIKLEK